MGKLISIVILSVVCGICSPRTLPKYIEKCSESDPKLNDCMVREANKLVPRLTHGDKKLHIPDLSPFVVDKIETRIGRLNLLMEDIKLFGLDKGHAEIIELNKDAQTLTLKVTIPEVLLQSTYTMKGQILILPVEGTGPMELKLTNAIFDTTISFENLRRDATENIKFLDSVLDYKFTDISMKFDNLFNGNKQLADPVNKLLYDERETIDKDFHPVFVETINAVLKSIIQRLFNNFHFKDIFLP